MHPNGPLRIGVAAALLLGSSIAAAGNLRTPPTNADRILSFCRAVLPEVHPWRAKQIERAFFRYEIARSYRASGAKSISLVELAQMRAEEIRTLGVLQETCLLPPESPRYVTISP